MRALLHPWLPRVASKTRPALALALVRQRAQEGPFPHAHYAFDNGLWPLEVTRLLARQGQPWVRDVEGARHMQGQGQRVATGAAGLRQAPPESWRAIQGRCRHGAPKSYGVFPKSVSLKRDGRTRLVIAPEHADLQETPRFFRTEALPGERGRVLETWSLRSAVAAPTDAYLRRGNGKGCVRPQGEDGRTTPPHNSS